jgi:hypothetical protein
MNRSAQPLMAAYGANVRHRSGYAQYLDMADQHLSETSQHPFTMEYTR